MKTDDPEIDQMLRECAEPASQKLGLVLGLVGAFVAGAVVFVAITHTGSLRGGGGALLLGAVLLLSFGLRQRARRR